ncbi:hypothetical protein I6N90_20600 [Paenibacillus sp. GSMTC-2017]|nr:hypothetical protein [Paenibacillus sp. GSMTC-2017]
MNFKGEIAYKLSLQRYDFMKMVMYLISQGLLGEEVSKQLTPSEATSKN